MQPIVLGSAPWIGNARKWRGRISRQQRDDLYLSTRALELARVMLERRA
jgi:hypothetical protein